MNSSSRHCPCLWENGPHEPTPVKGQPGYVPNPDWRPPVFLTLRDALFAQHRSWVLLHPICVHPEHAREIWKVLLEYALAKHMMQRLGDKGRLERWQKACRSKHDNQRDH